MAAFTTLALLGLSAATTAMSAASSIKAGNAAGRAGTAQRRAAEESAGLADFNANIAELQGKDAVERGAIEESRFRSNVKVLIGGQRADLAANNVDVGFGSAADVQGDAAHLGELDALQIRTNAAREAWGYQVQAVDLRKRAEIQRKEGVMLEAAGQEAKGASRWQAVGTIAGGATSLVEARYGFGRRAT